MIAPGRSRQSASGEHLSPASRRYRRAPTHSPAAGSHFPLSIGPHTRSSILRALSLSLSCAAHLGDEFRPLIPAEGDYIIYGVLRFQTGKGFFFRGGFTLFSVGVSIFLYLVFLRPTLFRRGGTPVNPTRGIFPMECKIVRAGVKVHCVTRRIVFS